LKIIPNLIWNVENYRYLCNVFHLETRPKIRKKGESNEF